MAKPFDQPKDPADVARYWYDFEPVLTPDETITGIVVVTIAVKGSDEVADLEVVGTPTVIGQTVYAVLASGTHGRDYVVTFEITTSDGQTFNRAAVLKVRDL